MPHAELSPYHPKATQIMMAPKTTALALLLGICSPLLAQEQAGIRLSGYGGINSALLNPAATALSSWHWDVNLLEGAAHAWNNYAYMEQTSLLHLWQQRDGLDIIAAPDLPRGELPPTSATIVDFERDDRRRAALALGSLLGPSFYFSIGEQHRLGLLTRLRFMSTARGVDTQFSYYDYFNRPFFSEFEVSPFSMAAVGWSEIGLHYAFRGETGSGQIAWGATLKALQGFEGGYWHNASAFRLQKQPNDFLSGSPIDFRYGHTNSNLDGDGFAPQRNGGGLGLDLGLSWTIDGAADAPYHWKMGVSLIDFGRLSFNRNARNHQVRTNSQTTINTTPYRSYAALNESESYLAFFSSQALGDSAASLTGESFSLWLPAALSLQIDHALGGPLYVGAALVQGLPMNPGLRRGSLLVLSPRLESRWLEAALPVSLYDWQSLRLGMAVRLAFLTIGTDHLGSIFRRTDFYGTDFYLALKVNPFKNAADQGWQRGSKRSRPGGGNRGKVRCYQF
jgi:hypothetical protein